MVAAEMHFASQQIGQMQGRKHVNFFSYDACRLRDQALSFDV